MNWFSETSKAIARGMGGLSPSCRQAVRLQSEAMDRKLSLSQRVGLRFHLLLCKWCRRYGTQLKFLRKAGRQADVPDEPPASGLSSEARERIRRKLEEARK